MFLSLICAGLWIAITWFIREVEAIRKAEELEKERKKANGEIEEEDSVVEEKKEK